MKFIKSYYNYETGESKVIMQHLGVKFSGKAQRHPEDELNSNFIGCEYAEIRAIIKALKYERKLAKMKSDEAIDFVKACECYKDFNKNDPTAKVLYRQLNRRIQKVNNLTDQINVLYRVIENKKINSRIYSSAFKNLKAKKDK